MLRSFRFQEIESLIILDTADPNSIQFSYGNAIPSQKSPLESFEEDISVATFPI
jgi:hypothetical protein